MKKVSELVGAHLDYWVLMARNTKKGMKKDDADTGAKLAISMLGASPSRIWAEGGAIIESERIRLWTIDDATWFAYVFDLDDSEHASWGETALIAAMRAYVASVYGEYIDQ